MELRASHYRVANFLANAYNIRKNEIGEERHIRQLSNKNRLTVMRRIEGWGASQRLSKYDHEVSKCLEGHNFIGAWERLVDTCGGAEKVVVDDLWAIYAGLGVQANAKLDVEAELIRRVVDGTHDEFTSSEALLCAVSKKDGGLPGPAVAALLLKRPDLAGPAHIDSALDFAVLKSKAATSGLDQGLVLDKSSLQTHWQSRLKTGENINMWRAMPEEMATAAMHELSGDIASELAVLSNMAPTHDKPWTDLDFRLQLRRALVSSQTEEALQSKMILRLALSSACRITHPERAIIWFEKLSIVAIMCQQPRLAALASIKCAQSFNTVYGPTNLEGQLMLARACTEALNLGRPKLARAILEYLSASSKREFWLTYIGAEIASLGVMVSCKEQAETAASSLSAAAKLSYYINGRVARMKTFFPGRILALLDLISHQQFNMTRFCVAEFCHSTCLSLGAAPEDLAVVEAFEKHRASAAQACTCRQ